MALTDNTFLRQYELKVNDELAIIEYSLQDRKIFLTKLIVPKEIDDICISPGGGFGPVTDDGYGISYMFAGEDTTNQRVCRMMRKDQG